MEFRRYTPPIHRFGDPGILLTKRARKPFLRRPQIQLVSLLIGVIVIIGMNPNLMN
jgi:hypothetical protein